MGLSQLAQLIKMVLCVLIVQEVQKLIWLHLLDALDYTGDIRTLDFMGSAGLYPGNYLSTFGGTSASCPQVSGVAALLLSINPKLTEAEVRNILGHSARKIGSYSYSTVSGHPFGTWNAIWDMVCLMQRRLSEKYIPKYPAII